MSLSNASMEFLRPVAYAAAHRSGPEPGSCLAFGFFVEVVHRRIDNGDAGAFDEGVARARNSRRPCMVGFEPRRGGHREQRVDELTAQNDFLSFVIFRR